MNRRGTEVPVVAADSRPTRVKPQNPGGMKIDGAENDVFSGGSDTADSKLAAAPETPDTKALRTPAPRVAETTAPVAVTPPPPPVTAAIPAPVAAVPPPAPPNPVAAAVETHLPASGHQTMVQLAALTSEEAARKEWQQLTRRMPELLNGRQPLYSRTERDGHTFWRVRTSGFADAAQARAFCEHVRAKGGSCSVADF
jgi:hypothetical protein